MEYKTVTIGSLIQRKRLKAKNYKESALVYAVTNNRGFVKSEDLHNFQIHSEDTSNYSIVEKNDFAYNPSRLNIGSIAYYQNEEAGMISPMYVVFSIDRNLVNPEYLFGVIRSSYVMQRIDGLKEEGARFRFDFKRWNNIEIKIPSLSEQRKIIDILNSFSSLITNLESELASRQKQYEYYRNKLLTFNHNDNNVEWKTLGEIFEFKNGLNKEKEAFGHGTPIVNYTDVYKNRGLYKDTINGLVSLNDNEIERYSVKKGDVFFTRTSETKEEVGYPAVMLDDIEQCTFSGFVLKAHPITDLLLPEYCKYCFFSYSFRQEVIKRATLTTRALTNGKSLSKITIPVPNKEKQQEIVSTLDTFESLITNIKQEIEARKKQYEYYREKLLTFE